MSTAADLVAASSARDLIPGDPGRLNDVAELLQSYSIDLSDTAVAFATLDSSTWTGQAADQFRAAFSPAPGHWRTAADAFAQASRAVSVYATSLLLAQDDAADALVRFRRGMDAMNHDGVTGGRGGMGATMGTDDPGRHDRDLAVIALDEARGRVKTAGATAHNAVRAATSGAPEGPTWWQSTAATLGVLAADGAEDVYNNVLVPVINGAATLNYALNSDPLGTLSVLGGALLVLGGGIVDAGGVAVCATGVGCAATPAAEAAGTGMILTGAGLVAGGAVSIGATAAANPITIVERTGNQGGGSSQPPPPRVVNTSGPSASPVWNATKPYRGKYHSNGMSGGKAVYYRWDYTHNEVEVYNSQRWEIGSQDPVTGEWVKGPPAKPRRPEELK